ncbi:hypothetical protein OPV22_013485 [Ensete ventricosum]|uniref:Uncharacterized protein n=1 Tax=Ensete ventricosum TaxID=4639 RepID=A0AAV8PN82_ENSVE|nr:hypothetical protein OPV22_013485 [Ensete ventricosum]
MHRFIQKDVERTIITRLNFACGDGELRSLSSRFIFEGERDCDAMRNISYLSIFDNPPSGTGLDGASFFFTHFSLALKIFRD